MSSPSSSTKRKTSDNTRRSNSEPARLRGRRKDSESDDDSNGARSMSRSRSRSRDREPRNRRHDDGGRLARDSPLLADALPKLGGMARAAVEQWGLDESRLLAWAAAVEATSTHPLAAAIIAAAPVASPATEVVEEAGHGITGTVDGRDGPDAAVAGH